MAAIVHDPLVLEDPDLVDAVGAAAALALETGRLDAELRARVEELRESRARLLAVGLAERRRMERNLHDGAQQRLVSLALDLRLARVLRGDPERAEELLDGVGEELSRALEELRELARRAAPGGADGSRPRTGGEDTCRHARPAAGGRRCGSGKSPKPSSWRPTS